MAMRAQEPAEAEPEQMERPASAWGGGMPDSLELLWGLLEIRREDSGEERLSLIWGLLDVRTRGPDPERSQGLPAGPAAYQEAVTNTERRVEALREASILGSVGLGLGLLWFLTDFGLWALCSVVLFAVAGGQVLSVFADRFRRPFLDEEMERLKERSATQRQLVGQKAREMQELTASIAHEIRNPITAAKSLVQQMGEDPNSSENLEYAGVALEELERVERSVSHLLRFARDEDVSIQAMRMDEVVASAMGSLEERAKELGVELISVLDREGAMSGDPEKLRRVVLNLVRNAIDALAESSTAQPSVEVSMGENLAGSEVWLRVRDNGPGIPADERPRVFTPFHTSKRDGTGLGLAITKRIVEAHHGSIEVGEAASGGAEFIVSLPKDPG